MERGIARLAGAGVPALASLGATPARGAAPGDVRSGTRVHCSAPRRRDPQAGWDRCEERPSRLTAMLEDPEAEVVTRRRWPWRQSDGGPSAPSVRWSRACAPPDRRCLTAAFALASIGEPALPALIDLLKADDPALRRAAIEGVKESIRGGVLASGQSGGTGPRDPLPIRGPGSPTRAVRIALARMLVV